MQAERTGYAEAIQSAVDALAHRLRRSVLVNDPMVRILYRSVHFGDEDPLRIRALLQRETGDDVVSYILDQGVADWLGPGRIPPHKALGMVHPRVCTPIRHPARGGGEMIGMIMMVDPEDSLSDPDLQLIRETAAEIAPLLFTGHGGDDQWALRDLLSRHSEVRREALAELSRYKRKQGFEHVTAVQLAVRSHDHETESVLSAGERMTLHETLSLLPGPRISATLHALSDTGASVVLGCRKPPPLGALTTEIERTISRFREATSGTSELIAGIGSPQRELPSAHVSARQAEVALDAVRRGLSTRAAVLWRDLGPMGVLLQLPRDVLVRSSLPHEMQTVVATVPFDELRRTLRVYLDHGGNGPAASEALHIHRTTLYYRLGRISELTGLDLADGGTRLSLHLGLAMLELIETEEARLDHSLDGWMPQDQLSE